MKSHRIEFRRLKDEDRDSYFEIKDPSVVRAADGTYYMYASLGTSVTQEWVVGRFAAKDPGGPWQELPHAKIAGVTGTEVCAPAMVLGEKDGKPEWQMYVQTTCFRENGVIALATSTDGEHFTGTAKPPMAKEDVPKGAIPLVGLYDVGMSDITQGGKTFEAMAFSGYRSVGNGDVYISLREKGTDEWQTPKLALQQEDVPFHNRPGAPNYEWGLEGAKVVQLADDAYLMIGVAFLDKSNAERGTRQRVFLAAANTPDGPFLPMRTPIEPTAYPEGTGENGHPDTVDLGDKLGIIYQERAGEGKPWHLRYTEMAKDELLLEVRARIAPKPAAAKPAAPKP
ncbi:MAG: hypothetical protein ACAH80_10235 [Alphaproteobacteria bacterium]